MRRPRTKERPCVGISAPSSPFDRPRFDAGLAVLQSLGFSVRVHPQSHERSGYLAGPDERRCQALVELFEDPSVDVVMAARGGYGAHRLLEILDIPRLAKNEKPLLGFSDVTALHAAFQMQGLMSIHGPVVTQLPDLAASDLERLGEVLAGEWAGLEYSAAGGCIGSAESIAGTLVGGCLSVLAPLAGTPFFPDIEDPVFLLEDVGEHPYRIDRMLTQLRLSGLFAKAKGFAIGEFVRCDPPRAGEPNVEDVLRERLGSLNAPVLLGLPFGHANRNAAVPLGAKVFIDASRGVLSIEG